MAAISPLLSQSVPPPSAGPQVQSQPALGQMMPNLTGRERVLFRKGQDVFERVVSVQGEEGVPNTEAGLGPYFNADSCASCHAYPAVGGSSPPKNPQIVTATASGARNKIPSFLSIEGPVFQARRRTDSNARSDGSVIPLFAIRGRMDATGCEVEQPAIEEELRRGNLSLRIPTPLFGLGLIEAIPESAILANEAANSSQKRLVGVHGRVNRLGRTGPITRFGWKAQVLSLQQFSAEAYLFEQGVTSETLPQKYLGPPPGCIFNPLPEDRSDAAASTASGAFSNVSLVSTFVRFLASPLSPNSEMLPGRRVFLDVGCGLCHTPTMNTGKSSYAVLSEQPVNLYSDLLVHRMGSRLADEIVQGQAQTDEFRTAPLWGVGSRLFLLHDGRARDLMEAIEAHFDAGTAKIAASEANGVVERYRALSSTDREKLIRFLKSL